MKVISIYSRSEKLDNETTFASVATANYTYTANQFIFKSSPSLQSNEDEKIIFIRTLYDLDHDTVSQQNSRNLIICFIFECGKLLNEKAIFAIHMYLFCS